MPRSIDGWRLPALPVATALLALGAAGSPALATCGSANCFLSTGTREGLASRGSFGLDLSYRYVDQSRKLSGTDSIGEVLTPEIDFEGETIEPFAHREVRTQNTLMQLDADYGVTERLTLSASFPFFNDRDHEHYEDVGTPAEHFTRGDGTSGFGDARISARYGLLVHPVDLLVGGLTLKVPTGAYKLRNGDGDINEPTIQPGSGAFDVAASLHYSHQQPSVKIDWFAAAAYEHNMENDLRYRMGAESVLSAGLSRSAGRRAVWSVQINGRLTARDEYRGEQVPSTGATLVNFTPGLRVNASSGTSFYAFVQMPIYQDVNEEQLAPRTGLMLGIARTFD